MKKKVKPKAPPIFLVKALIGFTNFLQKLRAKILPPEATLIEYLMGNLVMHRCIFVGAELMIANLLEDGPKKIEQLAKATGMNNDALYRVMRALSGIGIFKEKKGKIFENTKLSACLEYGKKDTVASLAKFVGSDWMVKVWSELLHSVESGKNHFKIKYGKGMFEWFEEPENWDQYRIFDEGMVNLSALSDEFIAGAYNFSHFKSLVDVGGGHGRQLTSILKGYPNLKGILFDLERVVKGAQIEDHFKDELIDGRVEFVGGSFFESIPAGHDAYFMKSILHDWPDEDVTEILANCRKAMHENSKLLVIDMIVKSDNKPDFSKILDVAMLILVDGKERTKEEFEDLFGKTGLKLTRVIPTASPYSIIEGVPV